MNTIILLSALSAGQLPAASPPSGVYLPPVPRPAVVAAQPPAALPPTAMPPAGMPPAGMPPAGMPPAANGNGNGNGSCPTCEAAKEEEPEAPEPYALMRLLQTTQFGQGLADHGISISGWLQGNYTVSNTGRSNLPTTFNDRADFFQFNQSYTKIEKAIDTSKDEFQFGFRADVLFGTDARFSIARGLGDDQTKQKPARNGTLPNYYPVDLYQAYGEVFLPNLGPNGTSVKVGRFSTHCGYELVQGAETPFVTRSYVFQYNPFTHTGVYATTQLNDTWTVSNGLVQGSDNFFSSPNRATYIGQLKWAPKEGKSNLLLNAVITDASFDQERNFPFYNVYNLVFTHNFNDKFSYVADAAYSHMDNFPGVNGTAKWYGVANYFIYKINDKLTSTLRGEVFNDQDGVRTTQFGNGVGGRGVYTAVTYGLAYAPVRSVIFRPTIRYDHNNTSRPFEGGKSDLYTGAFDVIIRY